MENCSFFSKRDGCVSVRSEIPCTLNWKLNPYIAKEYTLQNKIVSLKINDDAKFRITSTCKVAIARALCSQVTPKCSERDNSRDYGDANKLCDYVYSRCPSNFVLSLKKTNFCKNLKNGRHSKERCIAYTEHFSGACPRPLFKVCVHN